MLPAVRSAPPGGGAGDLESGTAWTGEKRRKTTRPSSALGSTDDDADMMDFQHHPPEDDSGLLVYSANDEISDEELDLCLRKVKSRQPTIDLYCPSRIHSQQEREELYERFCQLRMREFSKLVKPGDIHVPTGFKYPFELYSTWGNPCVPIPNRIFDWTIDDYQFNFAGLSDYQRIIPTIEDYLEYCDWDSYRSTISSYETDEDYVKYWDELLKRMKWVEEYQYTDDTELKDRGFKQAMKIASEFSHLPYSLACRGYEEYLWYMRRDENCKDLDNIYFEIWKRVIKKKMDFRQALEEILAANMFPSRSEMIKAEIQGSTCDLSIQFNICMEHIPKNVELDDVLGHIGHVLFELLIPKTYVYCVRKKLEIGRRLQLTPGQLGLPERRQ